MTDFQFDTLISAQARSPYKNSFFHQSDEPWLAGNGSSTLMFSIPDMPHVIDDDVTLDVLTAWSEIDPYDMFKDGSPLTVRHYEGPGDDGVDVYAITGETQVGEGSYTGLAVAVPVVELDGTVQFYPLDDFLF